MRIYRVILKNGKERIFKYFMPAVKCYWKEYGWDVKCIDKYLIKEWK